MGAIGTTREARVAGRGAIPVAIAAIGAGRAAIGASITHNRGTERGNRRNDRGAVLNLWGSRLFLRGARQAERRAAQSSCTTRGDFCVARRRERLDRVRETRSAGHERGARWLSRGARSELLLFPESAQLDASASSGPPVAAATSTTCQCIDDGALFARLDPRRCLRLPARAPRGISTGASDRELSNAIRRIDTTLLQLRARARSAPSPHTRAPGHG